MSPTRPPHGQPVALAAAPCAALATELLQLCERFFTTASPTVIAELHTFLVAEGVHPAGLVHRQSRLRHLPSRAG
jgi:hypothetical protein